MPEVFDLESLAHPPRIGRTDLLVIIASATCVCE
jgi:hypothetical protein